MRSGSSPPMPNAVRSRDRLDAQPARPALIGAASCRGSGRRAPSCPLERRPDRLLDMVGARGGEQQRLGRGAPALFVAGRAAARGSPRRPGCRPARGSRRQSMPAPRSASASAATWVDLPAPSPPSRLMKRPRAVAHAIPNSCLKPIQMRPKKPASPTASPATSGITCGAVSAVVTTRSAICWPLAIGALTGPW